VTLETTFLLESSKNVPIKMRQIVVPTSPTKSKGFLPVLSIKKTDSTVIITFITPINIDANGAFFSENPANTKNVAK
jgi:hypothetical protein